MNELKNCVIIFDKKIKDYVDKSADILHIESDKINRKYHITFTSGGTYSYNYSSVEWRRNPTVVDIENKLVFWRGQLLDNIKVMLQFENWFKIVFSNNSVHTYNASQVRFVKDFRNDADVVNFIEYLKEITSVVEETNFDSGFLHNELSELSVMEGSVLAKFLSSNDISNSEFNGNIYFPFSTNEAQIRAVKNALNYDFSVIQGPPGTGKTQTILNIIANLLIQGKKVAIVSGNNEATRNVQEKLDKENLIDLGAFLGNSENVQCFFEQDHSTNELLVNLKDIEPASSELFSIIADRAQKVYKYKVESAKIRHSISELDIEQKINNERYAEKQHVVPKRIVKMKRTAVEYLEIAAVLETLSNKNKINALDRMKLIFRYKIPKINEVLHNINDVIDFLQNKYYAKKLSELQLQLQKMTQFLSKKENIQSLGKLQKMSMAQFKKALLKQLQSISKFQFQKSDYKRCFEQFTNRHPIIYSTTHALRHCSGQGFLYDCVIIDESSQVDLASAMISFSCARKVVLVGDLMQLPHVVRSIDSKPIQKIFERHRLPTYFNYYNHSILKCVLEKYGKTLPVVLLNEHYRCDPQIIEFCNKRFYNNQLVVQTEHKKGNGITVITTEPHYARGRANERQADIIMSEILPALSEKPDIGVVAPYRDQVKLIISKLNGAPILVDTVHKFQGKERDVIIMSTVANRVTFYDDEERCDFLNNENLINVAISRAKEKLYLIASKEVLSQDGSLLKDFARYISYYCDDSIIQETKVYSVFDLMYEEYSPMLQNMKNKLLHISEHESENIIATLLDEMLQNGKYGNLRYKLHYPLRKIIKTDKLQDIDDCNFVENANTHCDFIIYNTLNKSIALVIEVDGSQHADEIQQQRDRRKDRLLFECGIEVLRIGTTEINCEEKISNKLKAINR